MPSQLALTMPTPARQPAPNLSYPGAATPAPAMSPRAALPSYPGGGATATNGGADQARLGGFEADTQAAAQKYGAGHFAEHWKGLTGNLDVNNNDAVEGFAKRYGVERGQVREVEGITRGMNNAELLQAAKQRYQNSPEYQKQLQADPTYQSYASGMNATQGPAAARRLGMNPYDVQQAVAGVQTAQNLANAIPVDAQSRATLAAGQAAGAAATGHGNEMHGQAALNDANNKATLLYPGQGNLANAQAGKATAEGKRLADMTPADVSYRNAETAALPQKAQEAKDKAALQNQLTQSQIDRNNRTGTKPQGGAADMNEKAPDPGKPTAAPPAAAGNLVKAPGPAAAPAAPAPAPTAAKPLAIGQAHAGSTVVKTGTHANGTKVYQLADGRVVDANGKVVQ